MAVFCGNDIIKISRVKDTIEKLGETFTKRVYTEQEINYCESRRMCKYQSYAARFAAKEAVYKAISPETSEDITWQDIEIKRMENGKPIIKLNGKIKDNYSKLNKNLYSIINTDNRNTKHKLRHTSNRSFLP